VTIKMPFLDNEEIGNVFSEKMRLEFALVHYAFLGNKCKNDIARLYDINLNSFRSKWSRSQFKKKGLNQNVK